MAILWRYCSENANISPKESSILLGLTLKRLDDNLNIKH